MAINKTATLHMSAAEARANFGDLLGKVYYTKQPVIVEKKGKPVAAMVSMEQYEALQRLREHDLALIEELQNRNEDKSVEEVEADVLTAVKEVRAERYERWKRDTGHR